MKKRKKAHTEIRTTQKKNEKKKKYLSTYKSPLVEARKDEQKFYQSKRYTENTNCAAHSRVFFKLNIGTTASYQELRKPSRRNLCYF